MADSPKVSVIIPTFNRVDFLRRALLSVLDQTFSDLEIILIDDCSPVDVHAVVKDLNDPRIRYFRHEINRGEANSRNTAIAQARGSYIAFLDDDDEWLPKKTERQIEIMESSNPEVGAAYSRFIWINSKTGQTIGERSPFRKNHIEHASGNVYKNLLGRNLIGTPSTVMIRKNVIDEVGGFDPSILYGVDHDFWLRIARHFQFIYIDEPLVRCYEHPDRLSNNLNILIQGQKDMMRKYPPESPVHRSYHSRRYFTLGERLCLSGDMSRGRRMFVQSIRLQPSNWRSSINLFFSLFGELFYKRWNRLRRKGGRMLRPSE